MIVDGKAIARTLRDSLAQRIKKAGRHPRLGIIVAQETREIRTFVQLKEKFGKDIGVEVVIYQPDPIDRTSQDLLQMLLHASRECDGLVLQLPLPRGMDLDAALNLFPLSHDVDVLGHTAYQQYKEGTLPFSPPVIAAMMEILQQQGVRLVEKRVLVIGEGRLVGGPAAIWAQRQGATVKVVNKETERFDEWTRGADVIISGAGVPGLLHPDNIPQDIIILDAGTSESAGKLAGDADPRCAEKAKIFTPTPGGVGPITVAKVFENLLTLMELKEKRKN